MPVYEIKQWNGGLSDYDDKGLPGSFKFGSNLEQRKDVDSLSCNQALTDEGINQGSRSPSASTSPSASPSRSPSPSASRSLSPTPSPSASSSPSFSPSRSPSTTPSSSPSPSPSASGAITSIFYDLIRTFVKAQDGYTYGFGSTGYIYRRDADGFWQRLYKDADGAIKGAAEWYAANGKVYLFWATDKKVKKKELPGLSNWNDVTEVATNLNSADWHTMRECGGSLIICNGPVLALVGYDQSYTNEALNLIPGNISKTLVERNGRTIVGTFRSDDPTSGINGAIDAEVPLAQIGSDGELYFADMQDTIPVKRFPGGGKVNPGGVCNRVGQSNFFEWEQNALNWIDKQSVGNLALFAVYDADVGKGGIYSYGRKNKNKPMIMNLEYQIDADELGAVIHTDGTTLVSYRDGSDFGVKAVDADNKAEATYQGIDFRAPVKKPIDITRWMQAEVFMKPLPVNSWVEFWYKVNKTGDYVRALTGAGDSVFSTALAKKALFRMEVEGEIFEPQLVLHPSANATPEIHRLRIYFN